MREIKEALDKLSQFIYSIEEDERKEKFLDIYEEEYDSPFSLSNLEFWEEAFELPIYIS